VTFLSDDSLLVADTGAAKLTVARQDGTKGRSWPMPQANTVQGPHVAALARGGWVATAPELRSLLYMESMESEPTAWATDPALRKPVGVATFSDSVIVTDPEAIVARAFRLP
jgi:hypothetical protein